jgi:hypothetical protein
MIAVLPTGAGKSLTYMPPAALADDTSVVILFFPARCSRGRSRKNAGTQGSAPSCGITGTWLVQGLS